MKAPEWPVGRWHLARIEVAQNLPADYSRIWRKMFAVLCTRSRKYAAPLADERTGEFFARAWSIERARRVRLEAQVEGLLDALRERGT